MKVWHWLVLLIGLLGAPAGLALASHFGQDGATRTPILIVNDTGSDATSVQIPALLSSQSFIDGSYMDSDALDSDLRDGSDHPAYMPGTGMVQMLSCFDDGGNDETVDCNDVGSDDITLPATGSEVFEFAADNQFRHLWVHTSTAAVADWTVTWEYWDGAAYQAFINVIDGSSNFETAGLQRVSWDFPAVDLWPESTLHSVAGYWIRARVSSFTSITTVPLGQQAWYETGRWWALAETIDDTEQKRFDLHLDVADSTAVTEVFPVAASADDAEINSDLSFSYPPVFAIKTSATVSTTITRKATSFPQYQIISWYGRFDTSSIPDTAQVTSASITCTVGATVDGDGDRSLIFEWFNWETIGGRHYEDVAQASAHTGTAIASLTSGASIFNLTNLHNINKAGYTGLRGNISGGIPSAINQVNILNEDDAVEGNECSLSVTYTAPKDYHYYFPHEDGYTLADDAALEPGATFHIKWAGYLNRMQSDLLTKGTALEMQMDADGNFNVKNGVTTLGPFSVLAGYHVIDVYQGGAAADDKLVLVVDGVEIGTGTAGTIADNATAWMFSDRGVASAQEYLELEVNQVTQFLHRIDDLPDHQLDDQTGNGFDAVARYPDTITGYTITPLSTEPISPADAITDPGEPLPDIVPSVGEIGDLTNPVTGTASSFALNRVWDRFSGADNPSLGSENFLPYEFFLALFAVGVVIFFGILAMRGFNSVFITYMIIMAGLAVFWKWGNLPWWFISAFGFTALPLLIWKRATP